MQSLRLGYGVIGNTTDSGPVFPGSSPGTPTKSMSHRASRSSVILFCAHAVHESLLKQQQRKALRRNFPLSILYFFGDAVAARNLHVCYNPFLYSTGDCPVAFLKYLPKNDWFGKFISTAISLMLKSELRNRALTSVMTNDVIHWPAGRPETSFTISERYLGDIFISSAYHLTSRCITYSRAISCINWSKIPYERAATSEGFGARLPIKSHTSK